MSRQLLKTSKKWNSTTSLGNLCQCFDTCKEVFPNVQMEPPVFQSVPSVSCHGTNEKSLTLSSLHSRFRYLYTLIRFPRAFLFPSWTVPAVSLFSQEKCCNCFIIFVALSWTLVCLCLVYTGELRTKPSTPGVRTFSVSENYFRYLDLVTQQKNTQVYLGKAMPLSMFLNVWLVFFRGQHLSLGFVTSCDNIVLPLA